MTVTLKTGHAYISAGVALLLLLLLLGCGGKGPVTPDVSGVTDPAASGVTDVPPDRISWGLWEIYVDPQTMTADVEPLREGQIHYNVLQMLEGWACKDCVGVTNLDWEGKEVMLLDVSIRHPYPNSRFDMTGRDVRGIAIFDATTSFPNTTVRDFNGVDTPILASRRLLNADGYTTHYNRWTALEGTDLQDYKRGRFAPASEINITGNLHPFKYFYNKEYKRLFYPGVTNTSTYRLSVKKFTPFRFAYSVDASWNYPHQWPVIEANVITAFDVSASAREAFQISMTVDDNQLTRQGGHADLTFDIFDHQGYGSISTITIEAPDLFDGLVSLDPASPLFFEPEMGRYTVTINNTTGHAKTADGGSDLLIAVEDSGMSVVGEDVKAYGIFTVPVTDPPKIWRPRDDTFQNIPFPGPAPNSDPIDLTVISDPQPDWAIKPGEPMLLFFDNSVEQFLGYNRNFDQYIWLAGYPGTQPSFIKSVTRIDAVSKGAFGEVSDSHDTVTDPYEVRHSTNIHVGGGIYTWSWFTGSMDDLIPHLELARDVSAGFGNATGNPIYSIYLFDEASSGTVPNYCSLHRIESPYNDYNGILRATLPSTPGISGGTPPYGVSFRDFVALGVDDKPVTDPNPYTVHLYTTENHDYGLSVNTRQMEVWEADFANPSAPKLLQLYVDSLLGQSVVSPVDTDARLVDVAVLPAWASNMYMGDGISAKGNWVAVLFTYDIWHRWFIEIYDAKLYDLSNPDWKTPIFSIGPYSGNAKALDIDPSMFEVYVLHDDAPSGTGALRMTCLEYY